MTLNSIKWIYPENPDPALPKPDRILMYPRVIVKQNPVRSVSRATDPESGDVYYIKYDTPRSLLKKIGNMFCSKGKLEFNAAKFLQRQNIPAIRYEALGECLTGSCLISRELKGYCSAAAFWYTQNDPAMHQRFITALIALLKQMNGNKILHPDFHLGNLMCRPDAPENLLLPDPYGIRKTFFRDAAKYNSVIVTNLAAEISADEGRAILTETGAKPELWDKLLLKNKKMIHAQWPRRKKQILSGNSKFSRTEIIDGVEYQIRNSRWYTPADFHPGQYKQVTMSVEKAMELWLESFKKEMLYDVNGHPKALCMTKNDAILFYDEVH